MTNRNNYVHTCKVMYVMFQAIPTSPPVPVNLPCLAAERPCSHYCLSNSHSSALQCSCPSNTQLENGVTCSGRPPPHFHCVCVYVYGIAIINCILPLLDVSCGNSLWSCGGDSPECYPRTYLCDYIPHCRNRADETCKP